MSNPHTDDDVVVAEYIFDLITANKANLLLDDVLYGNHTQIPLGGTAIVTAGGKRRELAGVSAPGGRTTNTMSVLVELHWSKVGDEATERRAVDNRATALEQLVHQDTTLGGIIIHGFFEQVDRGETESSNTGMFRTVRMGFTGISKTYLSNPTA